MSQDNRTIDEDAIQNILKDNQEITSVFIHELRNPLSLIKGTLQYIEMKHPEAKDYKYWSQLFDLIKDMEIMMSDASLLNSISQLNMKNTNLLALIQSVINNYMPQIDNQEKHLSMVTTTDNKSVFSSYYCDPDKIKQVLSNLLKNALEATSAGDYIEIILSINTSQNKPMLSIQINDTGQPIPEDEIATIFHPFVTNKTSGSGVGLALARRIIKSHLGTISVSSSTSLTSFTILLPMTTD